MQTSIRSSYQYYNDYGTLDCAIGNINHHQHHDQLDQLSTEDNVNSINQHLHHQQLQHLQVPLTSSSHHHHHQPHHQVLQVSSQGAFGLQLVNGCSEVVPPAEDGCNYPQDPQDVSIHQQQQQDDTRTLPGGEQLVIYDHQSHQEYQLLATNGNNSNNSSTNQTTDVGLGESLEVENIYQQQQHAQTTSSYQTIYYEPINFPDNCTPLEPLPVHQDTGEPREQNDFATSHLVQLNQFSEHNHHHHQSEQPQVSSGEDGCTYFQYLHHPQHPTEVELNSHAQSTDSPLPLPIDNLQQQTIIYAAESQLATTADSAHNHNQIYHTLGNTNTHHHHHQQNHNHNSFEQLDHVAATQADQQFRLHTSGGQPETTTAAAAAAVDVNRQHSQSELDHPYLDHQGGCNDDSNYHNNHNFYLDSESTGVSIAYSQESRSSTASTTPSEESSASILTRDEKRAREANIPMTYYEIVNLSIEQFNEQLARHNLSESQLTLIKDIRRRGKNKVAAQSCRKRKMEQIYELQHEVNNLAYKRRSLSIECSQLIKEHGNLVQEYDKIYAIIQERMQSC